MPISPINLVYKPSYTDNGNKYRRSNLGKTAMVTTTAAAVLSTAAKNNSKQQKEVLKTACPLIAIALMVGTFIDAVTNKLTSVFVDSRAREITQVQQEKSPMPESTMSFHQG